MAETTIRSANAEVHIPYSDVDWVKLREPFPPEQIGKLPKAGIELDFVGHAWVTERLNNYGGDWVLVPGDIMFAGEDLVYMAGTLIVGGVPRHDVGCADPRKQEWPKLLYSDTMTRCAMRHGIALALWQKEGPAQDRERPKATGGAQGRSGAGVPRGAAHVEPLDSIAAMGVLRGRVGELDDAGKARWEQWKATENWEANRVAATLGSSGLLEEALAFVAGVLTSSGEEPF